MPTTSLQSNFTCRRHSGAFLITYIKKRYHFKNVTRFWEKFSKFNKIFSQGEATPQKSQSAPQRPAFGVAKALFYYNRPVGGSWPHPTMWNVRSEHPQGHSAGVFHIQRSFGEHHAVELGPGVLDAAVADLEQDPVGAKGHRPQGVILHAAEYFLR